MLIRHQQQQQQQIIDRFGIFMQNKQKTYQDMADHANACFMYMLICCGKWIRIIFCKLICLAPNKDNEKVNDRENES